MKRFQQLSIALLFALGLFSCSKSNNNPIPTPPAVTPINWAQELKNTIWGGEYRYTSGAHLLLQPFSLILKADGTVSWSDVENTRPAGTWKVNGNEINFTFPNKTTLSATLEKDKWSNIKSGAGAGFEIDNISITGAPNPAALVNTTWSGTSNGEFNLLKFDNSGNVLLNRNGLTLIYFGSYTISTGGIYFSGLNGMYFLKYYVVLLNNGTTFKGITQFPTTTWTWTVNKQQ